MAPKIQKLVLRGSERAPMPGARRVGPADPNEIIDVTIVVRRRSHALGTFPRIEILGSTPLRARNHLTREQFAAQHGAADEDFAQIRQFAAANELRIATEAPARRSIILTGSVSAFSRAFDVELSKYEHPSGTYRCRTGSLKIPAPLSGIIEGVFGLDNRPQASPHFRIRRDPPARKPVARKRKAASRKGKSKLRARQSKRRAKKSSAPESFTPIQVAGAYEYPSNLTGAGQCIGILELGGGYNTSDLAAFFGKLGLKTPSVVAVSVDGGSNAPAGNPNSADGEVGLDIEVAGAIAPAAKIAVYFAPNTDQGFLDALTTAIHDATNKPSVISISWGGPESSWTQQAMNSMDAAAQDAATVGVTIFVAAGDNGATDGVSGGKFHVDFPASSPSVAGCGGTLLELTGEEIEVEDVWNDLSTGGGATGGGVSQVFALPSWQQSVAVPKSPAGSSGRGVPDVAGDADPNSGYQIVVDGQSIVVGGTSAVAPLWSGLVALLNQQLGKSAGFLNPLLYAAPADATFHDVTQGNNGGYSAAKGWDPCTGWGSPDGAKLLAALTS
ncbi:MAG: S53 family peptidase [Candidatus Acidiferrales bacterium]